MKTDFLKELGLEQEAIDKIMAENGKDIAAAKGDLDGKQTALDAANDTIKQLQDAVKKFDGVDVEGLKTQISTMEQNHNAALAQIKMDAAIDLALSQAKARNIKAAKALLDSEKIKLGKDGTLEGLDIAEMQKSAPYLFEIETKKDEGQGHEAGGRAQDDHGYAARIAQAHERGDNIAAIQIKQEAAEAGIYLA